MPVNYLRYSKADYESMAEWTLDNRLQEYGLPVRGDVAFKQSYAMGAFLWPDQYCWREQGMDATRVDD